MKKKMTALFAAGVLAVSLLVTGCGNKTAGDGGGKQAAASETSGSSGKMTTVRVGVMTGNMDQFLVSIGQEKGMFEKQGLQVEVTEFAAGINTVDALTMNNLDIGIIADYAWVNRLGSTSENTELRIFDKYAANKGSVEKLYLNTHNVSEVGELKDKCIATVPGTVADYWNARLIEDYELDGTKTAGASSFPEQLALFESDDVAAMWAAGQTAQKLEALDYVKDSGITLDDIGISTTMFFAANESYLKENADTAEKFLLAIKEVQDYIGSNPEDAAKIVEEKDNVPAETFLTSVESAVLSFELKQADVDMLNKINVWARENGNYSAEYDIADFVYTDILTGIDKTKTDITK